jgi:hypothetical protein
LRLRCSDPNWPLVWPFDSEWTLVIVTSVLVGITAYYAYQTRELANRPYTPSISASQSEAPTIKDQQNYLALDITNIGTSMATNLRIECSVPDLGTENQSLDVGSIRKGHTYLFAIRLEKQRRQDQSIQVYLKYSYKNIFNKKYKKKEELTILWWTFQEDFERKDKK